MDTILPIPFQFPLQNIDDALNMNECIAFWDSASTREWFYQRGYTLYAYKEPTGNYTEPSMICQPSCEMEYPYSHYKQEGNPDTPLYAFDYTGKIVYAQEIQDTSHHVAIKLIVTDSEEHRILRFLQSQGIEVLKENCLIPVLDILSNGPVAFVVMPRWGSIIFHPTGCPISNNIRIMHSLLKALAFLHQNNILHRDIKFDNVLVSHFSDDATYYSNSSSRRRLQWSNQLAYCLFDFDISMMLPANTDRARIRLPYRLSWYGSGYQPHDTWQGEFDYNPFAFDVGMLGRVLCAEYQHLTPQIPMLAPFLDRMTTRNIPLRFNATEALQFFEKLVPDIPKEVMNLGFRRGPRALYDEWDRWEGLPPDFIEKWKDYQEPPIPYSTAALRWIWSFEPMRYIIPALRLFFFRVSLVPSHITLFLKKIWGHVL